MKTVATVFAAGLFLIAPQIGAANKKPSSLPQAILNARAIYVDNQTNDARFQNAAYAEFSKWGRFQIAESADKADVVLRLSNGNHVKQVSGNELFAADHKLASAGSAREEDAVPVGFTRLSLIDPKSGNAVWTDQKKNNGTQPSRDLFEGLREAFEQSGKNHGAK